ncbi:3-phosphoshikimate 1-carboxyvinyltransferase [Magnetospirillum sp. SS-4]|uniref:3-phosphoshikimate 1-carboxyvinyltransferase n=1 Tax=Magnetospirillum sp. SS-4 TaxID=2681465 RepID=UPI00137E556C|nr:3-phosphoshikimate 1-carboxyvinyltransferase [Magnetospirillum sp. SS-4]CAA7621960.1 EpsP protein (modular protein) [Magnetospirillum sp. SS-4]
MTGDVNDNAPEAPFEADPFCKALFESLGPDIRASFTETQINALVSSLTRMNRQRHSIDLRAQVSLFFQRYYVVLLAGPDRRHKVMKTLARRRRLSFHAGTGATLGVAGFMSFSVLTVIGLLAAYLLKSMAGIDIFPDRHLWDFFSGELLQPAMHIANSAREYARDALKSLA